MTLVVIDASAILALLLPSQATPAARRFVTAAQELSFVAPFLFLWEVENVLLHYINHGKLAEPAYAATLDQLARYEIIVESPIAVSVVLPIARADSLSLFDAAYLDLALRRRAPLVSRDKALLRAAQERGVHVYDLGPKAA